MASPREPLTVATDSSALNRTQRKFIWFFLILGLLVVGGYLLWTSPLLGKHLPQFTGEAIETFTPLAAVSTVISTETAAVVQTDMPDDDVSLPTASAVAVDAKKRVCGQTEPMLILALGIDENEQSDVIRLIRVDFTEERILILSIPRDFWVPIPGLEDRNITQFRINAAYGYGEYFNGSGQGIVKASETIYQNYGILFDRYAVAHFDLFVQMVDALGGVDIYLDGPIGAYGSSGLHHLDGAAALDFSRERKADTDDHRILRQSAIIQGLYEKILQPEYLVRLPSLGIRFITDKSVITDMTLNDVSTFTCFVQKIGKESIVFRDIPPEYYTPTITNMGRYIKIPKPEATTYIQDLILNGNY